MQLNRVAHVVKLVPKPACAVQVAEIEASAHFGDLIEFAYPIGYSHWGVYDGDGYVIHFAVAGAHVLVSNTRHALKPSEPQDMKRRRDALLDKQLPYKLFTQNCEHFATFVRYGKAVCNQIPGKTKNKECEEATKVFSDIVWRETS
ncbi:hypothetical protein PGIGA_G00240650 [Pangasianodon gigas]|uniref:Uncharacterized protein n=1 Tax=Pangasianodon gigas TaxID=30993 RepID=A0ACC5WQC0_PANGG|nr:hypothetical protein [Pangasianodon gigas]